MLKNNCSTFSDNAFGTIVLFALVRCNKKIVFSSSIKYGKNNEPNHYPSFGRRFSTALG